MKNTRKMLSATLALAMLLGILTPTTLSASEIGVTINGTPVVFEDQTPVIVDGRTLVPVTDVFRALGFTSSWDGEARQTTLTNNDHRVVITIDNDTFFANGVPQTLDVPAQIINGRNMLPIRAVLEGVGKEIGWDGGTQTVLITYEIPFDPDVYVRDDGVRFSRIWNSGLNQQSLDVIFDDMWINAFTPIHLVYIGYDLDLYGYSPIEDSIYVWAFHGGPHPSEGAQFNIRQVPIWYYYSQYRNQFARPAVSNEHFLSTYEHFIDTQARPNATGRKSQFWIGYGSSVPSLPPANLQLDQGARFALQSGFSNDEIRHVFPFSVAFFNRHTNVVQNHFWVTWDSEGAWGVYLGSATAVGIRTDMESRDRSHAATAAHELAHSLGLNEHLAHIFDDVMVGFTAPVTEVTVTFESELWTVNQWGWSPSGEWVILYTTERLEENAHEVYHYNYGGWGRWDLYRNSAMDWVLMDLAGSVVFWEAVFWHDDSRYRELWQQHLGHFVSFETMQLARAGHEAVWHNSGLRQSFINGTGQANPEDLSHIGQAFINAFDTSLPQATRNSYAFTAQTAITNIANWARQQGLQPYESHFNTMPTRTIVTPIN